LACTTTASTRSPGRAPGTNTTRPSARWASPSPPATSRSISRPTGDEDARGERGAEVTAPE
jgi:hypothetical protein